MSSFHLLVVYGGCIFRKRDQIKNILKVSDNDNVERLLFHGTSSDVIDAICKHNFDHRCHGKNGTKYGKGSYFAVKASYSNNYCSGQTRFMFLARVLTGDFKQGDESLHRPPLKTLAIPLVISMIHALIMNQAHRFLSFLMTNSVILPI